MKLHLGCGKRFISGFTHIDVVEFPHIDMRHEVDRLPMIADGSADLIYACHVLEHFHRKDTVRVLSEWRRVLRPAGTLRLSVPDFAALVEIYIASGENLQTIIGPLFGRGDYLYNVHYTVFDFATLGRDLEAAGFSEVREYDWRTTEHAEVDDYSQAYFPHGDKDHGVRVSLNLEATKP